MSAARQSSFTTAEAHEAFEAALTRIEATIRYAFRRWPAARREEAMAEARAATWSAWHGLLRRGLDPVAVGVTGIAANACRGVKNGRVVRSSRPRGRGAMDVQDRRVFRELGLRVVSLEDLGGSSSGGWEDWLSGCRRWGPAEEAAFRIDFAAWLSGLPERKRRVAELLGGGLRTGEVACRLGVTAGAVSQARAWLASSWVGFQGGAGA